MMASSSAALLYDQVLLMNLRSTEYRALHCRMARNMNRCRTLDARQARAGDAVAEP